ncbi:lysine exporter protein [Stutzerimonas stutzeri TS44]|nr:lysine exporter protein [Stutzerimonas stutzeri TS44]
MLFSATVLPLVCTPGPDILFIASQAMSGGGRAGMRATTGVVLGYALHSLLVALGLAAVVAASPILFETIRWCGIAYLAYLACRLLRAALHPSRLEVPRGAVTGQLRKGLLTSLLNPKGMMIYIAILPQFMDQGGNTTLQAVALSAVFMFWCALVYSAIALALGRAGNDTLSERRRRQIDGGAGAMVLLAAGFMALAH